MRNITVLEKLHYALIAPKMARSFHRIQHLSQDEIRSIQNDRFLKLLRHAHATVPFYKQKYKQAGVLVNSIRSVDDIKELPVVEKSELIEGLPEQTLSTRFLDTKKLIMFVTGGTSGQVLKVYHSRESLFASLLSYHRAFSNMMGGVYSKTDVTAYVYTSPYPFNSFFGAYRHVFIWTLDPISIIRDKLVSASPHLLTSYPSVLDQITTELSGQDRRRIARRLRAISVNSEMSSQRQRDDWERQWGVPVLDEFCSEEVSTIMFQQCRQKSYHIQQDLCVLESADETGRPLEYGLEGNLIVTALWNYAMPLIRYNQQDRVVLEDPLCRCGCGVNFPLLKSFEGRVNDAFTLKSGRVLSSGYLLDIGYSTLAKYSDQIKYWALVQETKDLVVLECVFAPEVGAQTISKIEHEVSKLFFGEATLKIRTVNTIPKSLKGKSKQVVSCVQCHSNERRLVA